MRAGAVMVSEAGLLASAVALRWSRPDLTAAVAEHVGEVSTGDGRTWVAAAGWLVHGRAAVGDGRPSASDLLAEIARRGPALLDDPAADRLRIEVAVLAAGQCEPAVARQLVAPLLEADRSAEVRADALGVLARCVMEERPAAVGEATRRAELAWGEVGGMDAEIAGAALALLSAAALRRSGHPDSAVDRAAEGLARLEGIRGAQEGLPPRRLVAALGAEWITALVEAGRTDDAREGCTPMARQLQETTRPTRQIALLRLAMARALAESTSVGAVEALEQAARDAAECDAPDLEGLCLSTLGALREQSGRLDAALESMRRGVAAQRRDRVRSERFRAALGAMALGSHSARVEAAVLPDRPGITEAPVRAQPHRQHRTATSNLTTADRDFVEPVHPLAGGGELDPWSTGTWANQPTFGATDAGGRRRWAGRTRTEPERTAGGLSASDAEEHAGPTAPGSAGVDRAGRAAARPVLDAAAPNRGWPTAPDLDRPAGLDLDQQAGLDLGRPAALDRDRPAALDRDRPAGPDRDRPAAPNLDRQAGLDLDQQAGLDLDRPAALDRDRPAALDRDRRPALNRGWPAPDLGRPPAPNVDRTAGLDRDRTAGLDIDRPAALDRGRQAGPDLDRSVGGRPEPPEPTMGHVHASADPIVGDGGIDAVSAVDAASEYSGYDGERWLEAALVELERVWGQPLPDLDEHVAPPPGPAVKQAADQPGPKGDAVGCVVVIDVVRAGAPVPDGGEVLREVGDRLNRRIPGGARLRFEADGSALSVVLPGRERTAATDWMYETLPAVFADMTGLTAPAPWDAGTTLRATVHDTDGPFGAQLLQRLDVAPRPSPVWPTQDDVAAPAVVRWGVPIHAGSGGRRRRPEDAPDADRPALRTPVEQAVPEPPDAEPPDAEPAETDEVENDDRLSYWDGWAAPRQRVVRPAEPASETAGRHREPRVTPEAGRPPGRPTGTGQVPGHTAAAPGLPAEQTDPGQKDPAPVADNSAFSVEGLGLADLLAGALAAYRGI